MKPIDVLQSSRKIHFLIWKKSLTHTSEKDVIIVLFFFFTICINVDIYYMYFIKHRLAHSILESSHFALALYFKGHFFPVFMIISLYFQCLLFRILEASSVFLFFIYLIQSVSRPYLLSCHIFLTYHLLFILSTTLLIITLTTRFPSF